MRKVKVCICGRIFKPGQLICEREQVDTACGKSVTDAYQMTEVEAGRLVLDPADPKYPQLKGMSVCDRGVPVTSERVSKWKPLILTMIKKWLPQMVLSEAGMAVDDLVNQLLWETALALTDSFDWEKSVYTVSDFKGTGKAKKQRTAQEKQDALALKLSDIDDTFERAEAHAVQNRVKNWLWRNWDKYNTTKEKNPHPKHVSFDAIAARATLDENGVETDAFFLEDEVKFNREQAEKDIDLLLELQARGQDAATAFRALSIDSQTNLMEYYRHRDDGEAVVMNLAGVLSKPADREEAEAQDETLGEAEER